MKILSIRVPQTLRPLFIENLEAKPSNGWARDRSAEANAGGEGASVIHYIRRSGSKSELGFILCIQSRNETEICVVNILPDDGGKSDSNEYNEILGEFNEKCLMPVAKLMGLTVEITEDDRDNSRMPQ